MAFSFAFMCSPKTQDCGVHSCHRQNCKMDQSLVDKPWKLLLLRMDLPGDTGDVTSCAPHKMNVQRITLQDLGEHFPSSLLWLPHVWVVVLMMLLARLFQDEHKMHCEVMVLWCCLQKWNFRMSIQSIAALPLYPPANSSQKRMLKLLQLTCA